MNTSYPFAFATLKIRSIFSTVLFSVTLAPTASQFAPFSLNTSFCGSINTTAVSLVWIAMVILASLCCTATCVRVPVGLLAAADRHLHHRQHSTLSWSLRVAHMPCGPAFVDLQRCVSDRLGRWHT